MTSPARSRRFGRAKASFVVIPLLALLALVCWGFASPAGSTPDEGFHLQSIWCGGGATPTCEDGSDPGERLVSDDLVGGAVCYANNSDQTPVCQGDDYGDDLTKDLVATDGGNFSGLYPPVYYFTMSLFAGDNLQVSVLVMRAFNALLFVGLTTALFFLLPLHRRPTLLVSLAVTLVPLGIYLVASVNPSGWAIISAGTLWISLLGFFETTGRRRVALGAFAALAAVMGAGARADSAIFSVVAMAAVLIVKAERSRRFLLLAALPAALAIVSVLLFFSAQQSNAAATGLSSARGGNSQYVLLVQNFVELPSLFAGVFGGWPLGWLDTDLPEIVTFTGLIAFGGMVLLGFGERHRAKNVAALLVFAALVLVPMVLLYRSDSVVGAQVQPRYILPLMIVLAGIALTQRRGRPLLASPAQAVIVATALSVGNAVALHANIGRYVNGVGRGGGDLDSGVEWWWDAGLSPMGTWAVGSAAFAVLLFWLARRWVAYSAAQASGDAPTDVEASAIRSQ